MWHEAKMPVAVGTGGKTVAFRGELGADQPVATTGMTKVNLDEASIDTDSSFVDGKFQPSVSGYYQVNGAITQNSNPQSKNLQSAIYKNGVEVSRGSQTILSEDTEGSTQDSVVSDIVYLNGTTDYIELYGSCDSTGTRSIFSGKTRTYLSAVLVSGGSASGDSIWTEEDGVAKYSGDVKAGSTYGTGITIGQNGNSIKYSKDNTLQFNTNDTEAFILQSDGRAIFPQTPKIYISPEKANLTMDSTGGLFLSSATTYSAEETETAIDKKLAIKDKLIEKLSERLDKLEKKLKK
jgi:hypothetical protein